MKNFKAIEEVAPNQVVDFMNKDGETRRDWTRAQVHFDANLNIVKVEISALFGEVTEVNLSNVQIISNEEINITL